jgi:prepilin-type N-terminal cleavage/methylation domain-containing protein
VTTRRTRRAFTLAELIVVLAILVLLAAVLLPSLTAFRGDSRQRAAADVIRGELAAARARAKEEGRPYRVAVSEDGRRIRRAPDAEDFAEAGAAGDPGGSSAAIEYAFEHVTAAVVAEQGAEQPQAVNGWFAVACVQPDGTCREETVLVALKDENGTTLYLRIRGVTGTTRVVTNPNGASGGGQ